MNRTINAFALSVMILIIAMLTTMTAVLTPITVCAAENPLKIKVEQTVRGLPSSADNTFMYKLKPLKPDTPMPTGSNTSGGSGTEHMFTISGNGSVEVGSIRYSRQDIYRYELYQVTEAKKPGHIYDSRVYMIEVHVDEEVNVAFIVINVDGTKASKIIFENRYETLPSNPKLMADPPVKKTISGSPDKNSIFTFKLKAKFISQPMPKGSVDGVKKIQISGSGEKEFGTWSYEKEGVYYYTVSEINSGEKYYTYDKAVYTITDTVKEKDGRLVLSRKITDETNNRVETLAFNNKYSDGTEYGLPGHNPGGKDGPKTGDDMNKTPLVVLFTLGGILIFGAVSFLFISKKRKRAGGQHEKI